MLAPHCLPPSPSLHSKEQVLLLLHWCATAAALKWCHQAGGTDAGGRALMSRDWHWVSRGVSLSVRVYMHNYVWLPQVFCWGGALAAGVGPWLTYIAVCVFLGGDACRNASAYPEILLLCALLWPTLWLTWVTRALNVLPYSGSALCHVLRTQWPFWSPIRLSISRTTQVPCVPGDTNALAMESVRQKLPLKYNLTLISLCLSAPLCVCVFLSSLPFSCSCHLTVCLKTRHYVLEFCNTIFCPQSVAYY